jgi:PilZ domain
MKRNQRRMKAILPLKVTINADGQSYLGHTVEISTSGARTILPLSLDPGSELTLEYKHRRCKAKVVWSRLIEGRKSDHEIGLQLLNREVAFWMIDLAKQEDENFSVKTDTHFERIWAALKNSSSR